MNVTKVLAIALCFLFLFAIPASAQVQPMPFVKSQFFDQNGHPLAGGCVFTYQSGTLTPLPSYSDAAGIFLNSNPVILDAAGRANIFLTAVAYTLKLYTHGGVNCATGLQQWTIDGINPSANSILALNNVWTGTNDFTAATTFDASVTFNTGFTSTGPNILGGGGDITGTWTGSPTLSGAWNFAAGIISTTGTFSDQIISTVTTGTAPFVVASTTVVTNLNADLLDGCNWAVPCALGSTTPNTVAATSVTAASLVLNGAATGSGIQGTDSKLLTSGTVAGTGAQLCTDANGGATTSGCPSGFTKIQAVRQTSTCTPGSSSSFESCDFTFTWTGSFADTNYVAACSLEGTGYDVGNPGTNDSNQLYIRSLATGTMSLTIQNLRGSANTPVAVHCVGVHP